jgi:N-methylhydantoinase A
LHACAIAREIGMGRVIVPRAPGHFCAFGMLFSDLRYDYVRTWPARLAHLSFEDMGAVYDELIAQGREALERGGAGDLKVNVVRWADMRYVGQEHAVTIELPPTLLRKQDRVGVKERFDAEHQLRYGTCAPDERAEIVSVTINTKTVRQT